MKVQLTEQVRSMLRAIAQHADLICEGVEGPVVPGDAKRNARIDALVSAGALRPDDELSFRLNPRLRAFVEDRIGSFQAFRALTRIDPAIRHIETLWKELQILRKERAEEDAHAMEGVIMASLADLAYDIERNLQVLHTNIHDEYGNVTSLKAKMRQNDFFLKEVKGLKESIDKLSEVADALKMEAVAVAAYRVEAAIRRNIVINMLSWSQQINDALNTISKRLYIARKLHDRLATLSRVSLWLRQRAAIATTREFDLDEDFERLLLRPEAITVITHVDVDDPEEAVQRAMMEVSISLKPAQSGEVVAPDKPTPVVVEHDDDRIDESPEPHEESISRLIDALGSAKVPISLIEWRGDDPTLQGIEPEDWLLYASAQLEAEGFKAEHRFIPRGMFEVNDQFDDILIAPAHWAWAQPKKH